MQMLGKREKPHNTSKKYITIFNQYRGENRAIIKNGIKESLKYVPCPFKKSMKNEKNTLLGYFKKPEDITNTLRKQIEFYLGDPNLTKDKRLREIISQHKKGYISIDKLLLFNKMKKIFSDHKILNILERKELLIKSIEKSKILTLSRDKNLVKRKVPFNYQLLNDSFFNLQTDQRTIYVENLPPWIDHQILFDIFQKSGGITYISLPKEKTGKNKGFSFIEFDVSFLFNSIQSKEAAEKALIFNNSIPEEIESQQDKIDEQDSVGDGFAGLKLLKVMSKGDWELWKRRMKEIKKELMGKREDISKVKAELSNNSILKVAGLKDLGFSKSDLKIFLMHIEEPAYVDYKFGENEAYIRFIDQTKRDNFLKKTLNSKLDIRGHQIEFLKISKEEEKKYFEMINKKRDLLKKRKKLKTKEAQKI